MESDAVAIERTDAVGTVRLDRSDRHNAFDRPTIEALRDATVDLVEDDAVRCLVLTGTGPAFCAGADLGSLAGDGSDAPRIRTLASVLHDVVAGLVRAPKPVVTGVNGVAAGAGFGLAMAGDVVLVHEDARFEFAYPRVGLCGDGGSTYFLPRLVGHRRAREIALLDEPLDADAAVAEGLATAVVPDDEFEERVAGRAGDLAAGPTRAFATTKRLLAESDGRGLGDQLAAETDAIAGLTATADYAAGHGAFVGDGEATFRGE